MLKVFQKTAGLGLQAERLSELVVEIEREHHRLQLIEQEIGEIEGRYSISHNDRHSRAIGDEPDFERLGDIAASRVQGSETPARRSPDLLAALRSELSAIELCMGLPAAEFRAAAGEIGKAHRELKSAREAMMRAHLRLVISIAKTYRRKTSLDLLDLVQEGNLGLMRAIEKFNYRRGVKVSTYAVWWIRHLSRAPLPTRAHDSYSSAHDGDRPQGVARAAQASPEGRPQPHATGNFCADGCSPRPRRAGPGDGARAGFARHAHRRRPGRDFGRFGQSV